MCCPPCDDRACSHARSAVHAGQSSSWWSMLSRVKRPSALHHAQYASQLFPVMLARTVPCTSVPVARRHQYFCAAVIKNNADYCEGINTTHQKTLCKAHIERNPELCEDLPDSKDSCYQDYAINKGDEELCKRIKNPDKKNSCLGATTSNPELCRDINEEDKFACIVNLAEFTRNKELCEMLENKEPCYEHLSWIK